MGAPLEVLGALGTLVGGLKIPDKDLPKVYPVVYGDGRQMLELGSRPFLEVYGEELDDQVIILDPRHATRKAIVLQPYTGFGGSVVFRDVCWCTYLWGELRLSDLMPEGSQSWSRWDGAAFAPSFEWLLNFFLLLTPIVEDASGVIDASEVVLHGDTRPRGSRGLCPLLQDKTVCGS